MTVKTVALLAIWMCLLLLISISAVEDAVLRHLLDHFFFNIVSRLLAVTVQLVVVIGALFGTFYLTYLLVPSRTYKRKYVVEGSMLASAGWDHLQPALRLHHPQDIAIERHLRRPRVGHRHSALGPRLARGRSSRERAGSCAFAPRTVK